MARSRYRFTEHDRPHFLTCTIVEWLPVFTRREAVSILLDAWRYLAEHKGLKPYDYVVLENHLHGLPRRKICRRFGAALSPTRRGKSLTCWKRMERKHY